MTHRSEVMSDRVCIRGCPQRDVHWAACKNYATIELVKRAHAEDTGEEYVAPCKGCAPRECREGSLICDRCFGRLRRLLDDAPDLLGRLRSIGDPSKATVLDQVRVSSSSVEASAPIGDDLLDAIAAVELVLAEYGRVDGDYLTWASNHLETIEWLGAMVLDRHAPVDGIRDLWSVQDAVDRWGVVRRDTDVFVYPVEGEDDEVSAPVREWFDPLLTVQQAAERHNLTQRAVQKWVTAGHIAPVARIRGPRGSVLSYFRASAIDKTKAAMDARRARPALVAAGTTNPEFRSQEES